MARRRCRFSLVVPREIPVAASRANPRHAPISYPANPTRRCVRAQTKPGRAIQNDTFYRHSVGGFSDSSIFKSHIYDSSCFEQKHPNIAPGVSETTAPCQVRRRQQRYYRVPLLRFVVWGEFCLVLTIARVTKTVPEMINAMLITTQIQKGALYVSVASSPWSNR